MVEKSRDRETYEYWYKNHLCSIDVLLKNFDMDEILRYRLECLKLKREILFEEAHGLRESPRVKQKRKSRKHQISIVEFKLRKLLLNP